MKEIFLLIQDDGMLSFGAFETLEAAKTWVEAHTKHPSFVMWEIVKEMHTWHSPTTSYIIKKLEVSR